MPCIKKAFLYPWSVQNNEIPGERNILYIFAEPTIQAILQ